MTASEAVDPEVDLTLQQVAELTNLSTDALRRAIKKGDLQAAKLCGQIRVEAAELRRWKAANRIRPRVDGSPMLDVGRRSGGAIRDRLDQVERSERDA